MKVGIVVPYSWSFWGGVPEHADHQARALERLGVEARIIIGHDPPGRLTTYLHPRRGRRERPPGYVIPVGRSVIVPPNGDAVPEQADPAERENRIVFVGRHERRKGLQVLLRAWPEIRRRTGARLRVLGADPLQVRLLLTRHRLPDDGVDALGFVQEEE